MFAESSRRFKGGFAVGFLGKLLSLYLLTLFLMQVVVSRDTMVVF